MRGGGGGSSLTSRIPSFRVRRWERRLRGDQKAGLLMRLDNSTQYRVSGNAGGKHIRFRYAMEQGSDGVSAGAVSKNAGPPHARVT